MVFYFPESRKGFFPDVRIIVAGSNFFEERDCCQITYLSEGFYCAVLNCITLVFQERDQEGNRPGIADFSQRLNHCFPDHEIVIVQ